MFISLLRGLSIMADCSFCGEGTTGACKGVPICFKCYIIQNHKDGPIAGKLLWDTACVLSVTLKITPMNLFVIGAL